MWSETSAQRRALEETHETGISLCLMKEGLSGAQWVGQIPGNIEVVEPGASALWGL